MSTRPPLPRAACTRFSRTGAIAAEWAGWSQPLCSAAQSTPSRRIRSKTVSPDSVTRRIKRAPRPTPSRSSSSSALNLERRLGITKPVLRPDAPKPTSWASSTTTRAPVSARWKACESPSSPAPTTSTSASTEPRSRGNSGPFGVRLDQSEEANVSATISGSSLDEHGLSFRRQSTVPGSMRRCHKESVPQPCASFHRRDISFVGSVSTSFQFLVTLKWCCSSSTHRA